jgi:hypothetical protein
MNELTLPDALPVLSTGHHRWGSGQACAMDAVSFIMGKPEQGDAPECVHPVLRSAFIRVNDSLPDDRRHELWPLIVRVMGSAYRAPVDEHEAHVLNTRLAIWSARRVLHLVRAQDVKVCTEAIEAAERWVEDPSHRIIAANAANYAANAANAANVANVANAANVAYAANAANAAANVAYAANAANAADYAAYAANAANDANAANAAYAAYAANAAAYDAAYADYAANAANDANDANAANDANDVRLASLAALVNEFERLTNHTPTSTVIPWSQMVETLGAVSA